MDKKELIQIIYITCRKGYPSVLQHLLDQTKILSIKEYQDMITECLYFKTSIYDYPDGTGDHDINKMNYGKAPNKLECLNIILKKYRKTPTTFFKIMSKYFYVPIPIIQQIISYSYPTIASFCETP